MWVFRRAANAVLTQHPGWARSVSGRPGRQREAASWQSRISGGKPAFPGDPAIPHCPSPSPSVSHSPPVSCKHLFHPSILSTSMAATGSRPPPFLTGSLHQPPPHLPAHRQSPFSPQKKHLNILLQAPSTPKCRSNSPRPVQECPEAHGSIITSQLETMPTPVTGAWSLRYLPPERRPARRMDGQLLQHDSVILTRHNIS